MGSLQQGAYQAVHHCVRLQPHEQAVIITDSVTREIAEALKEESERIAPGKTTMFLMEDYGTRDPAGNTPLPLPEEIRYALSRADASFYAAHSMPGELQSFRHPMTAAVDANPQLRHAHMPDIDTEIMTTGMCADYRKVQRLTHSLKCIAEGARYMGVKNPAGTDFVAELSPEYKWVAGDGLISPDEWSNLPDGEVFTCVKNIREGIIVVDGILGDYFDARYGVLEEHPVTMHVESGRIREIYCENKSLQHELKEYSRQDENADRIGEIAIGTNISLDRLIGNLLQDEKFPGVHVAMGHGYPEKTGAEWDSAAHVDAVLKKNTVDLDGYVIMKDGRYTIDF